MPRHIFSATSPLSYFPSTRLNGESHNVIKIQSMMEGHVIRLFRDGDLRKECERIAAPSSWPPAASVCGRWLPAAASSSAPGRPPRPAASAGTLCASAGPRGGETAAPTSAAGRTSGWLSCNRTGGDGAITLTTSSFKKMVKILDKDEENKEMKSVLP